MSIITINSIRDGVIATIVNYFPDIPKVEQELNESMTEPCFYVKLLSTKQIQELGNRYRRYNPFDIQYFAVENRDLLNMAEQLYDKLGLIEIEGIKYSGINMKHEVINGVLHFNVEYNFIVSKEEAPETLMQNLLQEDKLKNG